MRPETWRHGSTGEADAGKAQAPPWMITFVDLISLMLTFLVMLFATSNIEPESWRKTADSLAQSLNWEGLQLPQVAARFGIQHNQPVVALDLDYLAEVLHAAVSAVPALQGIQIRRDHDRLVLSIPHVLLFTSGSAVVSPDARAALLELTPMLRGVGNRIVVEGHADPQPIPAGGAFASNWELSLARALAVADLLGTTGLGRRLTCYGLAESRFDELGESAGSDRHANARRVDLVFYASTEDEG